MLVQRLSALTVTTRITPTLARLMVTTVLAGSPVGYSSEPARGITAGSTAVLATVMATDAVTATDAETWAAGMGSSDTERLAVGTEVVKRAAVAGSTVAEVSTVEAVTAAVTGKFHT